MDFADNVGLAPLEELFCSSQNLGLSAFHVNFNNIGQRFPFRKIVESRASHRDHLLLGLSTFEDVSTSMTRRLPCWHHLSKPAFLEDSCPGKLNSRFKRI